jgi:uncharacterized membrane protein YtjA (UPF0391 family)
MNVSVLPVISLVAAIMTVAGIAISSAPTAKVIAVVGFSITGGGLLGWVRTRNG